MTEPRDRVLAIAASTTVNGIDFVEVAAPRTLVVHFLSAVAVADPSIAATITGGDSVPTVAVAKIDNAADWSSDAESRPLLTLHALADGDFSEYRLTITAPVLDIVLNSTTFSFKATCPSDFDCASPPLPCPPDDTDVPPIDYLAKDYQSFRQALLEFSALRYPQWVERSEADLGMMVVAELISAVGDEFSYLQDRVAAEGSLPTATQRRSLVSLARLVDYEPTPGVSAATILQCNVSAPGSVPAGARVSSAGAGRLGDPVRDRRRTGRHHRLSRLECLELRHRSLLVRRQASNAGPKVRPTCGCRVMASPLPPARRC